MLTRRQLLKSFVAMSAFSATMGGYALAEPFRLTVKRYRITPPGWPVGLKLKLAVVADVHACEPWMSQERVRQIVRRTNALSPDVILLLGDYVTSMYELRRVGLVKRLPLKDLVAPLEDLSAPLGVHGVLGNHDWWDDHRVQDARQGPPRVQGLLKDVGIGMLENDAVRLEKDGHGVWIAGLGDQWAFWPRDRRWRGRGEIAYEGVDDVDAMLGKVTTNEPVVVMAHEPDAFATMPARVALTLSGHTHGGQVRLLGFAPIVPSRFGRRYTYGHIVEDGRHLVVSGGLGCSGLPIRFGSPPEVVCIDLGDDKKDKSASV